MMKKIMQFGGALAAALFLAGCGQPGTDGCLNRGAAKAASGDWKEADAWAAKAVAQSPENVDALVFRAITASKCGQRDLALDLAGRAAALNPEHFEAQYTFGRLCLEDPGRATEAMQILTKAEQFQPDDLRVTVLLCSAAFQLDHPRAGELLDRLANTEYGKTAGYTGMRAVQALRRNDLRTARALLLKARQQDKSDPAIVLQNAVYFDRFGGASGKRVAKTFYRDFIAVSAGNPALQAKRVAAAKRMKML